MTIRFFLSAVALVVATCCVVSGCGGNSDLGTVSGTVTLDGAPLAGASVIFNPASGEGAAAMGETDESGRYTLYYASGDAGATLGKNKVKISKLDSRPTEDGDSIDYELVPPKYNIVTELTVEVKADGNTHDFSLESGDYEPTPFMELVNYEEI